MVKLLEDEGRNPEINKSEQRSGERVRKRRVQGDRKIEKYSYTVKETI